MINELISMNGYGIYVWSAFSFVLVSFTALFLTIKLEQIKERRKFVSKFSSLNSEKAIFAKTHIINQEILSITSKI
jgi:heme exporter protein D|tara:strand:- start:1171 stop:1398 length:228 start_codon:yes stop_codon:yes gene_type:complete